MPFFTPGQTAVDELKMRIETLESEYRYAKKNANRYRTEARMAEGDAAEICDRIEQYRALIPN